MYMKLSNIGVEDAAKKTDREVREREGSVPGYHGTSSESYTKKRYDTKAAGL